MTSSRPPLGAYVRGFAAWQFALILREPLRQRIAELERSARVHPDYVRQLKAAYAELVEAGEQWQERRVSAGESTEAAVTEIGSSSERHEEITPEEAAVLIGRSPARVRQLLRSGVLPGRRIGRNWLVERAAVEAYVGTPRRDVA
jgi:excisionase family DNA binding protein